METALCRGLGPSEDHRTERGAWFDSKDMPAGTTVRSRAARCRRRRSDSAPSKPTDGVITRRSRSGRPLGRPGLSGAPIRQRNHPVLGLPAWSTRPQTEKMETGATDRAARLSWSQFGAAAGAALIPPAGAATARSRPAASQESAPRRSAPSGAPSAASGISQLPLRATFPHLPAVPVDPGMLDTLAKLAIRAEQETQTKQGLTQ